jgi:hypothetical protein
VGIPQEYNSLLNNERKWTVWLSRYDRLIRAGNVAQLAPWIEQDEGMTPAYAQRYLSRLRSAYLAGETLEQTGRTVPRSQQERSLFLRGKTIAGTADPVAYRTRVRVDLAQRNGNTRASFWLTIDTTASPTQGDIDDAVTTFRTSRIDTVTGYNGNRRFARNTVMDIHVRSVECATC